MHEAGIMKSALDIVEEAALLNEINTVTEIKLVIGKKRVVLPDALSLAFEAFIKESDLFKNCKLIIEIRDILLQCKDCKNQFITDLSVRKCSECQSQNTELIQGNELYVDYFESGSDSE